MKTTSWRAKRLSSLGLLTALALILSYLESILPLPVMLPGFKLGLCNVVVLFCAFLLSLWDAALLSLVRVVVTSLLFGNITSFLFSLFGAALAFLAIALAKTFLSNKLSFVGVSVLSAAAFNVGQILAASLLYASFSVFSYLSLLLVASAIFGGVVGLLLNLIFDRIKGAAL